MFVGGYSFKFIFLWFCWDSGSNTLGVSHINPITQCTLVKSLSNITGNSFNLKNCVWYQMYRWVVDKAGPVNHMKMSMNK